MTISQISEHLQEMNNPIFEIDKLTRIIIQSGIVHRPNQISSEKVVIEASSNTPKQVRIILSKLFPDNILGLEVRAYEYKLNKWKKEFKIKYKLTSGTRI